MPVTDLSYVTVVGTFQRYDGSACTGSVEFRTDVELTDSDDTLVIPGTIRAQLDTSGSFTISLPATDDADFLPIDFTYLVREMVDDINREYEIHLPTSPATVDLAEVAPVTAIPTTLRTYAGGVKITDDDGSTEINDLRALLFLTPPASDVEVNGVVFKNPGSNYGWIGVDYSEGQVLNILSDSDAPGNVIGGVTVVITAVSNTTPVVLTAAAHGAQTGDVLRVSNVGITALDNGVNGVKWWKVTRVDANNVSLDGSVASGAATLTASSHLFGDPNPVLFRLPVDGSIGMLGAIHLATGLRGFSGLGGAFSFAGYQMHFDPSQDLINIRMNNAPTTAWKPTPVSPFIAIADIRSSPARTVFQVEADGTIRLRRQAGKADTAAVFRVRDDTDAANVMTVNADGGVYGQGPSAFGAFPPATGITLLVQPTTGANNAIFIAQQAAQTGDLLSLTASNFVTSLGRINKDGYFITKKNAAPADADLAANEMATWFTSTNGAARFNAKGKTADGTVVALTPIAMA